MLGGARGAPNAKARAAMAAALRAQAPPLPPPPSPLCGVRLHARLRVTCARVGRTCVTLRTAQLWNCGTRAGPAGRVSAGLSADGRPPESRGAAAVGPARRPARAPPRPHRARAGADGGERAAERADSAWVTARGVVGQILGDFRKTTDEGERLLLAPV
jgi:hypothetical protein